MQVPPTQLALGQAMPQPPQLKGSLRMSTQPAPQSTVGKAQPMSAWTEKQVPPSQTPLSQAMPHPPQLVSVSTQAIGDAVQTPPSQT